MFGLLKRSWFKAQALSILQMDYALPIKKPLSQADSQCLKEACSVAADIGGNQWDAAALFMLASADARLKASPQNLSEADHELLAKAAGTTLGLSHLQKKAKLWLERVKSLSEAYNEHPSPKPFSQV